MKRPNPINPPRMQCHACDAELQAYEKWVNNDQGEIFCVHVDVWCEYFRDMADGTRLEFCNPACVLTFLNSPSLTV